MQEKSNMGLKTLVKVGEISNLSDARYCAGMGVEMLGFNLDPSSSQFMSPESFNDITNWLAGVKFVGEFEDLPIEDIKLSTQNYTLDFIQIDNIDLLGELALISTPIIFKLNIDDSAILNKLSKSIEIVGDYCDYLIISSSDSALFDSIDEELAKIKTEMQTLKAFGIEEHNLDSIIATKTYSGIALKGSEEEKPGFKEYGALMDLLEALDEY